MSEEERLRNEIRNLNRFFAEYESKAVEQNRLLAREKEFVAALHNDVRRLTQENQELENKLRSGLSQDGFQHEDSFDNITGQLNAAIEEKEILSRLYHESQDKVTALERALHDTKVGLGLDDLERKQREALEGLEHDVTQLRKQLMDAKEDSSQLKRTNQKLRDELGAVSSGKVNAVDMEVQRLKEELAIVEKRLTSSSERHEQEKKTLQKRIQELQARLSESDESARQAAEQVRDAVATAETAVQEKNEMAVEMAQKKAELERLQGALNHLVEDAGQRTRDEVASVREQANARIEALAEEITQTEGTLAEAKADLERALRDKKQAEAELDRVSRDALLKTQADAAALEESQRRLLLAERERDNLQLSLDSLRQEKKREEFTFKSVKSQLSLELDNAKEQIRTLSASFDRSQNERVTAFRRAEEAEAKFNTAKREVVQAERKLQAALASIEQDNQMKLTEMEVRRVAESDSSRQAMTTLRNLLGAQQRVASKWKDEAHGLADRLESFQEERRAEKSRMRKRQEELSDSVEQLRRQLEEAHSTLQEKERSVRRLEERLSDLRHPTKSKQIHPKRGPDTVPVQ